jgi:hypothetical protein
MHNKPYIIVRAKHAVREHKTAVDVAFVAPSMKAATDLVALLTKCQVISEDHWPDGMEGEYSPAPVYCISNMGAVSIETLMLSVRPRTAPAAKPPIRRLAQPAQLLLGNGD